MNDSSPVVFKLSLLSNYLLGKRLLWSSKPDTNNEGRLGTSQVYEPDNWQNTSTNCDKSLPVTLVMTGGSSLSHSLCNLIEVMSIVILEQYDQ